MLLDEETEDNLNFLLKNLPENFMVENIELSDKSLQKLAELMKNGSQLSDAARDDADARGRAAARRTVLLQYFVIFSY